MLPHTGFGRSPLLDDAFWLVVTMARADPGKAELTSYPDAGEEWGHQRDPGRAGAVCRSRHHDASALHPQRFIAPSQPRRSREKVRSLHCLESEVFWTRVKPRESQLSWQVREAVEGGGVVSPGALTWTRAAPAFSKNEGDRKARSFLSPRAFFLPRPSPDRGGVCAVTSSPEDRERQLRGLSGRALPCVPSGEAKRG